MILIVWLAVALDFMFWLFGCGFCVANFWLFGVLFVGLVLLLV